MKRQRHKHRVAGANERLRGIPLDQTTAPIDYEGRKHKKDCRCEGCTPVAWLAPRSASASMIL
jgi:hypothetical protein